MMLHNLTPPPPLGILAKVWASYAIWSPYCFIYCLNRSFCSFINVINALNSAAFLVPSNLSCFLKSPGSSYASSSNLSSRSGTNFIFPAFILSNIGYNDSGVLSLRITCSLVIFMFPHFLNEFIFPWIKSSSGMLWSQWVKTRKMLSGVLFSKNLTIALAAMISWALAL